MKQIGNAWPHNLARALMLAVLLPLAIGAYSVGHQQQHPLGPEGPPHF